jgi:hypothetical protein
VFRNADDVEDFVCNFWSGVTWDEAQMVFHKWMRRVKSVCEHDGGHVLNKPRNLCISDRHRAEGWGDGDSLAPRHV